MNPITFVATEVIPPHPSLIFQRTTIMTIAVIRLLVISAVCNSPDCSFAIAATTTTTTTTTPTRHQSTTAKRRVFDFERLERNEIHHNKPPQMLQQETDRRVIPWVSIAILLNILFFFRSIAAPFFDPLVSRASCPFLCQISMVYLT